MPPPIPRNAMVTEDGNIVLPGQFDPTRTRARPLTPREYFATTGRINAKPQKPRYMGGGKFDILQNRDVSAFQDPRRPGMSVDEIAEDASRMGYTVGPGGVLRRDGLQPSAAAPSREQNIAAAKAAGTFEELRQKYNRENPDKVMDDAGNIDVKEEPAAKPEAGGVAAPRGSATARAGVQPNILSRGVTAIRNAIMGAPKPEVQATPGLFGATAKATQSAPAPAPAATVTPPPAVETPAMRRQMLRDAAMGRSETRNAEGKITGIQSKYGTGSVKTYATTDEERKTGKRPAAMPVAMTTDEFGKPETMKSYLARRRFIQGTKGFADPNPPANAPSASTPSASTPSASTPSASTPSASTPSASTPSASTPSSSFSKMSDRELEDAYDALEGDFKRMPFDEFTDRRMGIIGEQSARKRRREEGEAEKWAKETYKDINSWPAEKIYSEWTRVNSLEEQRKAESSVDQRKRDKALEILEKARNRVNEAAKKDTTKADRRLGSEPSFNTAKPRSQ